MMISEYGKGGYSFFDGSELVRGISKLIKKHERKYINVFYTKSWLIRFKIDELGNMMLRQERAFGRFQGKGWFHMQLYNLSIELGGLNILGHSVRPSWDYIQQTVANYLDSKGMGLKNEDGE
ncbi:MAG: hypothetical protein HRT87_09625 [Legionellales bacterium]|nr:hypothetical protein [Legionellales bacterium]